MASRSRRQGPEEPPDEEPPLVAWARAHDPGTSKAAAASLEPEALATMQKRVLEAVRAAGARGATTLELEAATGMQRVSISPRMSALARVRLIADSGERRAGPNGRHSIVWKAL